MRIGILGPEEYKWGQHHHVQAIFTEDLSAKLGKGSELLVFTQDVPKKKEFRVINTTHPNISKTVNSKKVPLLHMPALRPENDANISFSFFNAVRHGHIIKPYDVLCASTVNSAKAALTLRNHGYTEKVAYVAHEMSRYLRHWGSSVSVDSLEAEKDIFDKADAIILLTKGQERIFRAYYRTGPKVTVQVIPSALPTGFGLPLSDTKPAHPYLHIGMASSLCDASDYETALCALRRLESSLGQVVLRIAGDFQANPDWLSRFMQLAADLGVLDHIELLGQIARNKMVEFYRENHLTFVTSVVDSFALPALESLSVGVPVIGCDVGVLAELLNEVPNAGAVVPKRAPDALAEKTLAIYSRIGKCDPGQQTEIRDSLRTQVNETLKGYTWSNVILHYRKLFKALFNPIHLSTMLAQQRTNQVRERLQQRMVAKGLSIRLLSNVMGKSYEAVRRVFDQSLSTRIRWSTFEELANLLEYTQEEINELGRIFNGQ